MPDSAARPHVVVVGGGIAGLAAAHAVARSGADVAVTVLEGGPSVGGKLRLGEVAGQPVDLGAEAMLNRRPEGTALARAVGLEASIVHPRATSAGIWSSGEVRPLPPTVMGIPAEPAAAARSGLLNRRGRARAELDRWLPAAAVEADVGVGRLVARRLGSQVRDRLVEPLLGGVYAGRSDEISLQAAIPQIADLLRGGSGLLAAAARVLSEPADKTSAGQSPVFAGIDGGLGRLAVEVARDLIRRGAEIRCATTVRGLERTQTGWRLVTGSAARPEQLTADAVIIAVPAGRAARLLSDALPHASGELGEIDYASVAIVTVALRALDVTADLPGSGFLVPPIEKRTIKAATYSSRKWAWFRDDLVVIRCSIGRHRDTAELQRDDGELVESAAADLRDAVGLPACVVDANVTRWGGALPQYAVGHVDRVRRIQDAVAGVPRLGICGAAFDGVGIAAVVASGQQAATRVLEHLRKPRQ